jgi:hypothetical protein
MAIAHSSLFACPECGARYAGEGDGCMVRFELLLALDHSRLEPWGSRHGQAFAVFALQHPSAYPASLDAAWDSLYRIYVAGEAAGHVFRAAVQRAGRLPLDGAVPPRPARCAGQPSITIADLGDFAADSYAADLDAWCRATLTAWGLTKFSSAEA